MNFQFTIRSILIVTAISAIGIFIGKRQYDRWHWVNNPIELHPYASLEHVPKGRPVLIIVAANWTPSSSLGYINNFYLNRPDLRTSMYDKRVIPVHLDCTDERECDLAMERFDFESVPFVCLLSEVDGRIVYAGPLIDPDPLQTAIDGL